MFSFVVSVLSVTVVGAGHLASWNFEFANSSGQKLWRVCTLVVIITAAVIALLMIWIVSDPDDDDDSIYDDVPFIMNITGTIFMHINVCVYIVARFVLIFLVVYSFYSLPAGSYDTRDVAWLQFIPFVH